MILKLNFDFLSYWHAGSGNGSGSEIDHAVIKTRDGLPYLPGKTIRGLFREASQTIEDFGHCSQGITGKYFGSTNSDNESLTRFDSQAGILIFTNAALSERDLSLIAGNKNLTKALFKNISSTKLENGIAANDTLRVTEYCIPLKLFSEIRIEEKDESCRKKILFHLEQCTKMIRSLGYKRHRGYGKVKISIEQVIEMDSSERLTLKDNKDKFLFHLKLESDCIFTQDSATEGAHTCLDYIPGSAFLGLCAEKIYNEVGINTFEIFHSGQVRFGNAYPYVNGKAFIPIPLSYHYYKGSDSKEITNLLSSELEKGKQAKQIRNGYFFPKKNCFGTYDSYSVLKNYVQKTAINRREFGKPMDTQFFGYESIAAGQEFYFSIYFDSKIEHETRRKVLEVFFNSTAAIGRSRNAEYGRVKFTLMSFDEEEKFLNANSFLKPEQFPNAEDGNTLYLLTDFAILDEKTGRPTYELPILNIEKSFLQKRTYSPFNGKRRANDSERYLVTKGSVFQLKGKFAVKDLYSIYEEEGLGQYLLNPDFLNLKELVLQKISIPQRSEENSSNSHSNSSLVARLQEISEKTNYFSKAKKEVRDKVNEYIKSANIDKCPNPSQWGKIRELAIKYDDIDLLLDMLLNPLNGIFVKTGSGRIWKNEINGKPIYQFILEQLIPEQQKTFIGELREAYAQTKLEKQSQKYEVVRKEYFSKFDLRTVQQKITLLSKEMIRSIKNKGRSVSSG